MRDNVIQMGKGELMRGFLLLFEDHWSTATMHASVTPPSAGDKRYA
jgi:hypothetical protein